MDRRTFLKGLGLSLAGSVAGLEIIKKARLETEETLALAEKATEKIAPYGISDTGMIVSKVGDYYIPYNSSATYFVDPNIYQLGDDRLYTSYLASFWGNDKNE